MRILLTLLLAGLPLNVSALDRYSAEYDAQSQRVHVQACFEGHPPTYLQQARGAARFSTPPLAESGNEYEADLAGRIRTSGLAVNSCLKWRVDLGEAARKQNGSLAYDLGPEPGDGLLTRGSLWFWRDNEKREISVEVHLPDGYSISTPWKPQGSSGKALLFRPARTPADWASRIALGRFQEARIPVGGTELRVAAVGDFTAKRAQLFFDWIEETAQSVATVHGRYPQDSPQILLIGAGRQREAVPWANVLRGGGVSAGFYIDPYRPIREFREDWTATHELSHMLLPYVSSRDRWLSEGLASYYQNVLRARAGRLSEEQAWQKLNAGFERGRRATRGESLAEATRSGRRSTMRVYWSGAAMMLKADSRLRALTDGRQSLDTVLRQLYDCCMEEGRTWRARDLFTRLDELTGYDVFVPLYRQNVPADQFPDLDSTYRYLGLNTQNGRIRLVGDARGSRIRYYIMNG